MTRLAVPSPSAIRAAIRWLPLAFIIGATQFAACADFSPTGGCCRVCIIGSKPCGDVCISNAESCSSPRGCACRGS